MGRVTAKVIKASSSKTIPASKAESKESKFLADIIEPPYNKAKLFKIVEQSNIIPQCIEAYKQNIPGFGSTLKYNVDESLQEETEEMKEEWDTVKNFINYFNFEKSFEDVFKDVIGDRECCGEGYIEILRNGTGLPVGGERIDTTTIKVSKLSKPIEVTYEKEGKKYSRYKRFRKFLQEINGSRVYFKEFGDPRKLNYKTGEYGDDISSDNEATELIQLKIGNGPYGIPRWIGNIVPIIGSRKAEELNYNYFDKGRHTPLAILVKNGILTEESEEALADYAAGVEGVENAHKFLLLQMEEFKDNDSISLGDDSSNNKMDIELKDLAGMLQQDALFLDYDESSRKKAQSSFRLPDIYVGRSTDFNRATAEAAIEITEKQVFIPERNSLAFIINNLLLDEYNLKFVKVIFNNPDISNTDDKVKMITALNSAGAIAPNDLREELGKLLGKQLENFDIDTANLPPILANKDSGEVNTLQSLLKSKIDPYNSQIINVLKDVRDVLEEFKDGQDK